MKKKSTKHKILVAEDDPNLLKVLSNALKEEGFKVFKAENGQEGLELALKHHPDLIVLDVLMPVMDGLTMLKKLRKDEWGKNVYAIILTNVEPSSDLISEASRYPYMSSYYMKSEYGINEVVDMVKERLHKKTIENIAEK